MYKIGIIQNIHEEGIKLLTNHKNFDYEIIDDVSEENILKKIHLYDGVSLRTSKLTNKVLSRATKLKVISRHGVGYDNVDVSFLKKKNIKLLITATANATAVAEHVFYLMLTISKNYLNLDNEVRLGNFKNYINKFQTFELNKKEILIAGFGRIGKNLIKKCNGFDMKVKVYDPFIDNKTIENFGGRKIEIFHDAVKTADFLSIHMPLNNDTKNLINYKCLQSMKKNAVIINTARGGIVNELDLDKALNENIILAAGLDVFVDEPINVTSPLLKNKKIILSPHTAALTNECKIRMAKETTQNIIDFFENNLNNSMIVKI
ncbi:MAG: hydroxyacid dehydrogenase [Pelagibacteraceae bacterium]|jgi:D-3-phosphoglycerate dehydrogenase / 2-oxoglutarate reductase|nr:hydroxyacid dehydrogenase [Pelagibacteraceae bacterium]